MFTPKPKDINELNAGEIGFIITGIKKSYLIQKSEIQFEANKPLINPLPGFKPSKPVVFVVYSKLIVQNIKN